jgi:hypothetical protein
MVSKSWSCREKRRITVRSCVRLLVRSFMHLLVRSFMHLLVRSSVHSSVRLLSWSKWNSNVAKKWWRGEEGAKLNSGQKKVLIANRGLKSSVHWHTLLEECVGRLVFLNFNLEQTPNSSEWECYYNIMLWCCLDFWMTSRLDQRRLNVQNRRVFQKAHTFSAIGTTVPLKISLVVKPMIKSKVMESKFYWLNETLLKP